MTPFELFQWAIAAAGAVLIVGLALVIVLALVVSVVRYQPKAPR